MPFTFEKIDCQRPPDPAYVRRSFIVVKAKCADSPMTRKSIRGEAARAASAMDQRRGEKLAFLDALAGVVSRLAWFHYIDRVYGAASGAQYGDGSIVLSRGEIVRPRASFPRNGVKFALCHDIHNFKVIHSFNDERFIAARRVDFCAASLFPMSKRLLDKDAAASLYLVGGAVCESSAPGGCGIADSAKPGAIHFMSRLADSLDMAGFNSYMESLGYMPRLHPRFGEAF